MGGWHRKCSCAPTEGRRLAERRVERTSDPLVSPADANFCHTVWMSRLTVQRHLQVENFTSSWASAGRQLTYPHIVRLLPHRPVTSTSTTQRLQNCNEHGLSSFPWRQRAVNLGHCPLFDADLWRWFGISDSITYAELNVFHLSWLFIKLNSINESFWVMWRHDALCMAALISNMHRQDASNCRIPYYLLA
jgi:hypothetical protein